MRKVARCSTVRSLCAVADPACCLQVSFFSGQHHTRSLRKNGAENRIERNQNCRILSSDGKRTLAITGKMNKNSLSPDCQLLRLSAPRRAIHRIPHPARVLFGTRCHQSRRRPYEVVDPTFRGCTVRLSSVVAKCRFDSGERGPSFLPQELRVGLYPVRHRTTSQ